MSDNLDVGRKRGPTSLRGLGASITRHSTAEQAAEVLRSAILEGRLLPGDPLREAPLAAELGISRSSLREAIRILEGDHLIRYQMNRGATVAELSDQEIDDLFAAREVLEMAGLRGLQEMTSRQRAAYLEPFVHEIEAANERGDVAAAAIADREFHTAIVAAAGNAHLSRWYEGLRKELGLAVALSEQHRGSSGAQRRRQAGHATTIGRSPERSGARRRRARRRYRRISPMVQRSCTGCASTSAREPVRARAAGEVRSSRQCDRRSTAARLRSPRRVVTPRPGSTLPQADRLARRAARVRSGDARAA